MYHRYIVLKREKKCKPGGPADYIKLGKNKKTNRFLLKYFFIWLKIEYWKKDAEVF